MDSEPSHSKDFINEIYSIEEKDYLLFLAYHEAQLKSNGIPEIFWKPLCIKLKNQIFDAGNSFSIFYVDNESELEDEDRNEMKVLVTSDFIDANDRNNIYLIDHAWTYKANEAKIHLTVTPQLLERMAKLMNVQTHSDNLLEEVCSKMWKFNLTYSCSALSNVEDRLPIWYIMDEFGSAIQHSDEPNYRVVPFLHLSEGIAYSLLFPIKNSVKGDEVTRDYVEGCTNSLERRAKLLPWRTDALRDVSFIQDEPSEEYFLSSRQNETLPNLSALISKDTNGSTSDSNPLGVFSQYSYVNQYLTSPKFSIVLEEEKADILWLTTHFKMFKEFSEISPSKFVNQFPFESVLTIKDLLAIICRRARQITEENESHIQQKYPSWLPITYNLNTELPKYISYFQHREELGLDNTWICKPWNLARGMDTLITNNLNCIIRLSTSGPKIAQKYIENPVLFFREGIGNVKFDVRYVVLLKSVQPLEVYAYKNFFLRFANKAFELSDFDDYEKHFTVMNYNENTPLYRLLCADFIREFNIQYPDNQWCAVEPKIVSMLREVFQSATAKRPPCGIGPSPQSRALYAVDLMLSTADGVIEPKLLEINWTPDCQRACEYYPDFYNDIFELLFLDDEKDIFIKVH